jgi:hypothetical protein
MERVTVSPYEVQNKGRNNKVCVSAEANERIFDKMKGLLDPQHAGSITRQVVEASREAKDILGVNNARVAVEAHWHIASAGMLYGVGWEEGIIKEKFVGKLPVPLLIMCLQEQRICTSSTSTLSSFFHTRTLNSCISEVFPTALDAWNFKNEYPRVARCKKPSMFPKTKPCLKCVLFVIRAWHCFQLLKETSLDESLRIKIKDCLDIVERKLVDEEESKRVNIAAAVEKGSSTAPASQMVLPSTAATVQTSNKKRPVDDISSTDEDPSIKKGKGGLAHELMTPSKTGNASQQQGRKVSMPSADTNINSNQMENRNSSTTTEEELQPSDGTDCNHKDGEDNRHWYPDEVNETILNPTEIEFAWLLEECLYCYRKWVTDWRFIYQYSSPHLKVALRGLPPPTEGSDPATNEAEIIRNLVRLDEPSVEMRFFNFRREVRRRLFKGETRASMKRALQHERTPVN